MSNDLTVVIPAKNEECGLSIILKELSDLGIDTIVVNDGSTDKTEDICRQHSVKVISHRISKGNGAAVKTGIATVKSDFVALMDADGQHSVGETLKLYENMKKKKLDLIVGARSRANHSSGGRWLANSFYNRFASFMVNKRVDDLTSGQRVFDTKKIKKILWLLPDTFSYPTTSTMAFYRLGYDVEFMPVVVKKANGKSHIKLFRDGFRFALIIMKIGTLFSPFKLFVPVSVMLFFLGAMRYLYTFIIFQSFTNMSALLFVSALIVFLMGVVSEQISTAIYMQIEKEKSDYK